MGYSCSAPSKTWHGAAAESSLGIARARARARERHVGAMRLAPYATTEHALEGCHAARVLFTGADGHAHIAALGVMHGERANQHAILEHGFDQALRALTAGRDVDQHEVTLARHRHQTVDAPELVGQFF